MAGGFFNEVYEAVKAIPYGKVATYGDIAKLAGRPGFAKQVGWALHSNPDPKTIPCHKVVDRFGNLAPAFAFGGKERQKLLLEKDGVAVSDEFTVDLKIYRISLFK